MQEAIAKLTQEGMILFCLLFSPAGQKEILMDAIAADGPADQMIAIRADAGFDVFKVLGLQKRRLVTITAVKDKPFVFKLKGHRGKESSMDLSEAVKAIKPLKQAPTQIVRVMGTKATVVASGKNVYVHFRGAPLTFVVHEAPSETDPMTQPSATGAVPSDQIKAGTAQAKKFWGALAKGETGAMKGYYAPKVTLKAGSELLKKQWGGSGDRNKDHLVDREKLIDGYKAMIARIGKEKWTKSLSRLSLTTPGVRTFVVADKLDSPFSGIQKGDLIMRVGGDSGYIFVLRRNKEGNWLVVAERTDY